MNKLKLIPLFLLFFLFIGCQEDDFISSSYKTLAVSNNIYDAIYKSLGEAYKQGLLSEEYKEQAIQKGNMYYNSYMKSARLLYIYAELNENERTEGMKTTILIAIAQAITEINSLKTYIELILNQDLNLIDIPVSDELQSYLEE